MTLALTSAEPKREGGVVGERPQLIADLFHALNQPITALQCSLELGLRLPHSEERYRDTLQVALQHVERIAQQLSGIRGLMQAEDPGDHPQVLSLTTFLRELVSDLEPVAESLGVELFLQGTSPCHVQFEPHRLQQALFYLLEFALWSSPTGKELKLDLSEQRNAAVLTLSGAHFAPAEADGANPGPERGSRELSQRLALAIVGRTMEAAGGTLRVERTAAALHIELRLPLESALQ